MTKRPNIQIRNQTDGAVEDYADERGLDKSEAYEELLQHATEFRPVTDEERDALVEWLIENHYGDTESSQKEAKHTVETSTLTAIDGYTPDSPGFSGTLILAIFGWPGTYTLYRYVDGELEEIQREAQR